MSLIYCPECGHEISNNAVACPNCGRPINAPTPVIERNVIVADPEPERSGFPAWAFVPIGIAAAVLLFVIFTVVNRDDEANTNVSVNVAARRSATDPLDTRSTESQTINVPPSTDTQTVTVPNSQTTIPGTGSSVADRGTVTIEAKIATQTGAPQAVKNEKFYLLDKDLESILSEANLDPIEGQSLLNSFGLSVVYPDRYGSFNSSALRAINSHIKYSGQTDATGKAELGGIDPNGYYLFGVTKTGKGFAIWSSPVSINAGPNVLNLTPARLTEMSMP